MTGKQDMILFSLSSVEEPFRSARNIIMADHLSSGKETKLEDSAGFLCCAPF